MADSFVLFTVLALIVAILQILPRSDIIELQASLSKRTKILLVGFIVFIIFLMAASTVFDDTETFSGTINGNDQTVSVTLQPFDFWNDSSLSLSEKIFSEYFFNFVAQILAILFFIICVILYSRKGIVKNTSKFIEDLDELYKQRDFFLFFKLVGSHYDFLIADPFPEEKRHQPIPLGITGPNLPEGRGAPHQTSSTTEDEIKSNDEVRSFIRGKFQDPLFIKTMARLEPNLGVKISLDDTVQWDLRRLLVSPFFRYLLLQPESILHCEIQGSRSSTGESGRRYVIPAENRIISEICSNLVKAKDIGILGSFADTTIELLKRQLSGTTNRKGTVGVDNANNTEPNPIISGIDLFDIFVREALFQKIQWHMGPFTMYHFVNVICERFQQTIDPDEHYTRYEFPDVRYIEDILYNLVHWIGIADDEPENIDLSIGSYRCDHENGNIIKSSIISFSRCIQCIILSEKMPLKLKKDYTHLYLRTCFNLCKSDKEISRKFACMMARCLVFGFSSERRPEAYRMINEFLEKYDTPTLTPNNPDGECLYRELLQHTASESDRENPKNFGDQMSR
jgi:hypothetical protein